MNEWDFKLRYLVVGSIYSWKNNEIVILFVGKILQVWDNVEKKTCWEKKKKDKLILMQWNESNPKKKKKLGLLNQKKKKKIH